MGTWLLLVSLLLSAGASSGDLSERALSAAPRVTESVFRAPILDIRWLGPHNQVLVLLTQDAHIHRSSDGGKTWADITSEIGGASMQVIRMILSPADSRVLAVLGSLNQHYVSSDGGLTWREMKMPPGKTRAMLFHSTRSEWVLFSSWTHGCHWVNGAVLDGEVKDGGICNHAIYATKDLGRTFVQISSHVLQFDWGDGPHADRIYFSHFTNKEVVQPRFDHWMEDVNFAFTDDWHTSTDVIFGGNKFVISHGYVIVATVMKKQLGLKVSRDSGTRFKKVVMPRHLKESSYIILDTSEDAVVLHVNHGHGIGHIYVSDLEGVHYTLSLENNVRGRQDCGFEKVKNLRGIYLANVRDPSPADFASAPGAPKPESHDEELEGFTSNTQSDRSQRSLRESTAKRLTPDEESEYLLGGLSTRTQSDKTGRSLRESPDDTARRLRKYSHEGSLSSAPHRSLADVSQTKNIRTVVSFDRGGAWTYVKPPAKDSLGVPIVCPPDKCWLHMHDITEFDAFVPFYSYTHATGIIMGTGNVGPYLMHDRATTNTYLSRDGGLTWIEAHKGDFIYEFGNHGGLLMMSDWVSATKQVFYSSNQGYSWQSVEFSPQPMNVSNILTERDAMSTKFVIFGMRGRQGVLYHIDFEPSVTGMRVCKGLAAADSASSDYETWTPSDGRSEERCLLGRQSMYSRRKQLANCLNNKDLEWPVDKKNCTCTEENFECAPGFHRGVESMECVPEHEADFYKDEDGRPGVCAHVEFYAIDAYRKVSGDTCVGGTFVPVPFLLQCKMIRLAAKAHRNFKDLPGTIPRGVQHVARRSFLGLVLLAALSVLALVLCCCCQERVKYCLISMQLRLSGNRDYSKPSTGAPSASDAQNIGRGDFQPPTLPREMDTI